MLVASRLILVAAVAASACAEPRDGGVPADSAAVVPEDPRVTRADSGGVEVVVTAEPLWDAEAAWRIGDEPELAVAAGDLELQSIAGVVRLAGGGIAVADASAGAVVVIDTAGAVIRRSDGRIAGRRMRQLFWIGSAGDTVLAYDLADHRLVRLPPSGAATAAALRTVAQSSFTALRPLGRFESGGILAASGGSSFPFPGEEYEVLQDSATLLRYAPSGRVRDTLAVVPWGESFGVATGAGRRRMLVPLPRPYGRATSVVTAANHVFVGTGDGFEISVLDTTGALVRSIRVPAIADSLPREAVDSYQARVRRRVESGDSGLADRALVEALEEAPYPATTPAYERLLADPDGVLWVLDAAPVTRESVTWRVFDAEGRWLGVVGMPSRFMVHEIGRDYVLGVWAAEDGGREVRMYPIVRPEPPAPG